MALGEAKPEELPDDAICVTVNSPQEQIKRPGDAEVLREKPQEVPIG